MNIVSHKVTRHMIYGTRRVGQWGASGRVIVLADLRWRISGEEGTQCVVYRMHDKGWTQDR